MKKLILTIVGILSFAGLSFGQNVTIFVDGNQVDISGQTYTHVLSSSAVDEHVIDFIVNNESGTDQPWLITRYHVNNPAGWSEFLCWGLNGAIGNCYVTNPNPIWSSGSENILADSSGRLSTYVSAPNAGSAMYRYYISTDGINFEDSVDLQINFGVGVEENSLLTVSISPNPANDFINITTSGADVSSVRIVDVLGNLVYDKTLTIANKKLDISKFRNGIYFVTVNSAEGKSITRKVIVRR